MNFGCSQMVVFRRFGVLAMDTAGGHRAWGGLPIGASSSIGDDRGGNPMELTLLSYEIGIRRRRRGPVDA